MNLVRYFKESTHPFYGSVVALVMFLCYEVLLVAEPFGAHGQIRNAPEAWVRTIIAYLGVAPQYLTFVMITFSLLALAWFSRTIGKVQWSFLAVLVVESMCWGAVSGVLIQLILGSLFFSATTMAGGTLTQLGLSVGAGLFEELFFRVFLTTLLFWGFTKLMPFRVLPMLVAVVCSALLFSASHYIGSLGDPLELYSFMFRFAAGLWFTTLFATRGFAVVSLTHGFYDIFLVLS